MTRKFSVLMSVYHKDDPSYFETALNSLIQQTVPPDEIVLVKDGPISEELEEVISTFHEKYDDLKIVEIKINSGLGNALNEGLKYCRYDLVARMDSDDISEPDRFGEQVAVFEADNTISICGGWISEFEGNPTNILSYRRVPIEHADIIRMAHSMSPMNHVTVMFKKSDVMAVGSYMPFYQFEDYYLWVRLIKAGFKFKNVPFILVNVRGGRDMASRRGGGKYIRTELKFQSFLLKSGMITHFEYLKNCAVRTTVRMLPNSLRSRVYTMIRLYQQSKPSCSCSDSSSL